MTHPKDATSGLYCDNPRCDSEAVATVPVSVNSASDGLRRLCAACEEAYTWGVQHGKMLSGPYDRHE
jgi:hypothetical protein